MENIFSGYCKTEDQTINPVPGDLGKQHNLALKLTINALPVIVYWNIDY